MKIVAIIQARMASSRLPGKVMKEIAGQPMLLHVVKRARMATKINDVVVATTVDSQDDVIEEYCHQNQIPVYRGSELDVLDRYYQTAKEYNAEVIVRLTADCPVLDPGVIDRLVNEFIKADVDFAANRLPPPFKRTYPIGLDAEVCTFTALGKAWHEAKAKHEREHVMPYFYEEPGRFKILQIDNDVDYGYLRWTVDTEQDLELVRKIFSAFNGRLDFGFSDILDLINQHPEFQLINQQVNAKKFDDVDERY